MSPGPLVTVGIASFNNAQYISETLQSIADQTYPNIELVVVDDCSTDDSVQVIRGFLKTFRFPSRIIVHEKNKGVVAVCNRLLKEVAGEYYCLVGSDDVFYPNKIASQLKAITGDKADMVFSAMEYIGPRGEPMHLEEFNELPHSNGKFVFTWAYLLGGSFITAPTVMLRTQIARNLGGYDSGFSIEDLPFWLKLAKNNARIAFLAEPLVKYRVFSSSLSSKITTLISHARIVASASGQLTGDEKKVVRYHMWHRIVSNNDSNARIPEIPRGELLYWICLVNRTKAGHFLLYKFLTGRVLKPSFQIKLEAIKKKRVI